MRAARGRRGDPRPRCRARRAGARRQPQPRSSGAAVASRRSPPCATAPSCSPCRASSARARVITKTLRAQTHEFNNQLHTISGLIQLGEYDEVSRLIGTSAGAVAEITEPCSPRRGPGRRRAPHRQDQPRRRARRRLVHLRGRPRCPGSTRRPPRRRHRARATWSTTPSTRPWLPAATVEVALCLERRRRPGGGRRHRRRRPSTQGRIFRRGSSTKARRRGRGVGLALVQVVCERREARSSRCG